MRQNEEAVAAFIAEQICLTEIPLVIQAVMDSHSPKSVDSIETVLEADRWARALSGCRNSKSSEKTQRR